MKNMLFVVAVFAGSLFITSCDDFLETDIQRNYDEEMFLNSGYNNLMAFGIGVYDYLHHFNGYGGSALLASACDEADYAKPGAIHRFNTGAWGPFSNPNDVFAHYYKGIRHSNLFLEKTENYLELIVQDTLRNMPTYLDNVDNFTKLRAEVRYLRAFFYMELVKRYGGVPIVTEVLEEQEAFGLSRDSFEDCIDFIVSECDEVYPELANHYTNYGRPGNELVGRGDGGSDNSRLGRIEKPAALALKQRALLYAASPLHNPSNDIEKWEKAVVAGEAIFSSDNCSHIRFLNGSYKELFHAQTNNMNLTPRKGANSGIIMTRPFERNGSTFERANYPVGMIGGGVGATCPSQNLVDAYEMRNGKSIVDPESGYDPSNPFFSRDPRLAFTIVLNGSTMGLDTDNSPRQVQSFEGGNDGIGSRFGATTTGYYLRKMVVENFNLATGGSKSKSWVLMRYAEVLLNYAEAANEAFGPDVLPVVDGVTFSKTARQALNEVRSRASVVMPPIPAGLTKEAFRDRLWNERRVELSFEEHRFFDVRRWKVAEETENAPLLGMRVAKGEEEAFTYNTFIVEERTFSPEMYLFPIPFQEISKSAGKLNQNPGW